MEAPLSQLPPGDTRLIDAVVNQLKSRGIFDKFRKECLADVDTKPAFQNLKQRVDGHVKKFLGTKTWKSDLNKNQIRDGVRKDILESGILDAGIDAIINQVVNPKITPLILPFVEDTVYAFLQIEKPMRESEDENKFGDHHASLHQGQYNQSSMECHRLPPHLQKNVYSDPPEVKMPKIKTAPIFQEIEVKKIKTELKTDIKVIPMVTDAISSEEDETLLYSNGKVLASTSTNKHDIPDVKMEEDNAVDSFDSARNEPDMMTAAVEKLSISELNSHVLKSEVCDTKSQIVIFDQQSLDSISSNSSNLSFSSLPAKRKESVGKMEDSPKGVDSMDELRSCQSTPLEDERSLSSQTSGEHGEWSSCALPKDLPTAERIDSFGESVISTAMVVSGASPISAESQNSLGTSPSKDNSETPLTEDSQDSISRQKLSLDEVSSSTSAGSSRHSTPKEADSNSEKGHSSKSASTDGKSRKSSHHDDRSKYSKRHKHRNHSKTRDDHSSHRRKDNFRRDRDDDSDKDRRSKSRYHSVSSSHHSSHHSSRHRREHSNGHSSSHRSDKHGKSRNSDHHRSNNGKEKSSKRDCKEHTSKSNIIDSSDIKKSEPTSKDKCASRTATLPVQRTVNSNVGPMAQKETSSSRETEKNKKSAESYSIEKNNNTATINDSKLKRNGSFTENKKKVHNGTKENFKSLSNKIIVEKVKVNSSENKSLPPIRKRLLPLEEDITLMGNLNKKDKIVHHKISREPNNNIKSKNKTDVSEKSLKIYSKNGRVENREEKHVAKNTTPSLEEDIKKVKRSHFAEDAKKVKKTPFEEDVKKVKKSPFEEDAKKVKKSPFEEDAKKVKKSPFEEDAKKVKKSPFEEDAKKVKKSPFEEDAKKVKKSPFEEYAKKRKRPRFEDDAKKVKRPHVEDIKKVNTQFKNGTKIKRSGIQPKIITNGLIDKSLKRKLTVSLEDISPSLEITNQKRRKMEKTLNVPPTNSQRLVICSFNADATLLQQGNLDDSDDGSDFEGFEPPPKRLRIDQNDMFSEADSAMLYDFEGFPDNSSPNADTKIRSYLARMNHTGNCSRYSD